MECLAFFVLLMYGASSLRLTERVGKSVHVKALHVERIDSLDEQWVKFSNEAAADDSFIKNCLSNRNLSILLTGNSVSRGWLFALKDLFNESDCPGGDRACEKTLCGAGGNLGGVRPGQGNCFGDCGCEGMLDAGIRVGFLWQQRIWDKYLQGAIEQFHPDILVMNSGGDDIFDKSSRPSWKSAMLEQAPQLRNMFINLSMEMPKTTMYWKTTTHVCGNLPKFGTHNIQSLNPEIHESNKILASQLGGIPGLRLADVASWAWGLCGSYDSDGSDFIHHAKLYPAHLKSILMDYCKDSQ